MEHIGQSRPDSGLGVQVKVFTPAVSLVYRPHNVCTHAPRNSTQMVPGGFFFFFTLVTGPRRSLSLKLCDTGFYEPQIRARLGTTALFGRGWQDLMGADDEVEVVLARELLDNVRAERERHPAVALGPSGSCFGVRGWGVYNQVYTDAVVEF